VPCVSANRRLFGERTSSGVREYLQGPSYPEVVELALDLRVNSGIDHGFIFEGLGWICESVEVPALWARHSGNKRLLTTYQLAKKGLAKPAR
jgi:hypothetical protein